MCSKPASSSSWPVRWSESSAPPWPPPDSSTSDPTDHDVSVAYTDISYEVADRVLTITLDRPDRLNAFTYEMHQELIDACDRSDAADDIRAIVVTGRGRGFCAGADLGAGSSTFDHSELLKSVDVHRDEGGLVALRIFRSTKPVIAAVNGPAVGVGVTMMLPMDIRL